VGGVEIAARQLRRGAHRLWSWRPDWSHLGFELSCEPRVLPHSSFIIHLPRQQT
jgi:hypothetical protein